MKIWNFRGKQKNITEALQLKIPEHAVISITGAGGKTSLTFEWAKEFASSGKKVAIATTTHMFSPENMKATEPDLYEGVQTVACPSDTEQAAIEVEENVFENIKGRISAALAESDIIFVFSPDPERPGKVTSPPAEILDFVYDTADVTLIEADGSRQMPLKWPSPYEPVVPDATDITVCVAGLSALGQRPEDVIYRCEHMPETFSASSLRSCRVDEKLINSILISNEGGQKGTKGELRFFLNQADDEALQESASRIQKMLAVCGLQCAWGSLLDAGASSDLKIAVILEAAGSSTRFGSNKLMYIMENGLPMISGILNAVRDTAADVYAGKSAAAELRLILVTGYDEVIRTAEDILGFLPCTVVRNDHPELGISRTMQLGIEAAGDADAYMFCVCDQPGLKASTIERLIDTFKAAAADAGIVSLSWQGELRNPKIFSSKFRNELMGLSGDTGGRHIIAAHKKELLLVEADSEDEVRDIDYDSFSKR